MKRPLFVCALCLILLLHVSATSSAKVPEQVNYQGRLINGTNLVNGQVSVVLRVYDSETDGVLTFADSNDVVVVDGFYSIRLGAHPLFGTLTNALAAVEAWVEVDINGTILSPREQLLAAPYALADRTGDLASNVWSFADSTTNYLRRSDERNPISVQYANQNPVYFPTLQEGFRAISNNCYVEVNEGVYSVTGSMPAGYLPQDAQTAGLYLISKENVTIRGVGMPTILATNTCDLLALYGCKRITVEGIRFSGSGPSVLPNIGCAALVDLMGTNENTTFRNCHFVNFPSHGISQLGGPKCSRFTKVTDCLFTNGGNLSHTAIGSDGASVSGIGPYAVIENNFMLDVLRGAELEGSDWPIRGVRISGNTIRYWRDAVVVYPSDHQQTNMASGVIEDNVIIGLDSFAGMTTNTMPGPGIVIDGGERWRIANNTVRNFGPSGITAWSFIAGLNNVQIIGNMVASNHPGYPTPYTINGIYVGDGGYGASNIIVQGNVVSGCDGAGIWLSGTDTKAIQNVVRDCQYAGILVQHEGKNERVFLDGNIEYNSVNGLVICEGVTGTVVRSNYAYRNSGADLVDLGKESQIGGWVNISGGTNRVAIGNGVTNRINNSVAIRGSLYLDGGKRVYTNTAFGSTNWGVKAFTINHPLDPQNKVLRHYCLEGPVVQNMYNGSVTLDGKGEAMVALPPYFEALNTNPQYVLTPVGASMPNLHVMQKIHENRFWIAGGSPAGEVSWMVIAQRNDPAAIEDLKQRPVEQLKSELKPGQAAAENAGVNANASTK